MLLEMDRLNVFVDYYLRSRVALKVHVNHKNVWRCAYKRNKLFQSLVGCFTAELCGIEQSRVGDVWRVQAAL